MKTFSAQLMSSAAIPANGKLSDFARLIGAPTAPVIGTVSIAEMLKQAVGPWVVPAKELSLTAGVMQAFEAVFAQLGTQWLTPIFAVMIVCAMLGGMIGWLAGPSKGLLKIGTEEGLRRIGADDVKAYYRSRYQPARTIVSLAGDLDPERAIRLAERTYGEWSGDEVAVPGSRGRGEYQQECQ